MSASVQHRLWLLLARPLLHLLRWLVVTACQAWPARRASAPPADRIRVYFLLHHAYGMGGTIRAVLNLAGHLARTHDVEVISVVRRRKRPFFPIPEGLRVSVLDDRTAGSPRGVRAVLARLPSVLVHEQDGAFRSCSALTDLELVRTLRRLPSGVLVTTRPGFGLLVSRLALPQLAVVAQEHVSHHHHRPALARAVRRGYPRLSAVVALTEADQRFYTEICGRAETVPACIPNAVPAFAPSTARRREVVVSAGRLVAWKRFDRLVDAFAAAATDHPAWQLHIHGSGPEHARLSEQIVGRKLTGRVILAGRSRRIDEVFATASVLALASSNETFGLVVVEAMSCGLPVVCFDSGGPAEIVHHGQDGLLVPDGDLDALTAALRTLMSDGPRRARMGAAAVESAARFRPAAIGARWADLLAQVAPGTPPKQAGSLRTS